MQERFGVILLYGQKFRTLNVSGKGRKLPFTSNKGFTARSIKISKATKLLVFLSRDFIARKDCICPRLQNSPYFCVFKYDFEKKPDCFAVYICPKIIRKGNGYGLGSSFCSKCVKTATETKTGIYFQKGNIEQP